MYLENVVLDSPDPARSGRFWQEVLGLEPLTEGPEGYEGRLAVPGGPVLDLCIQPVPAAGPGSGGAGPRVHLDLAGGPDPAATVARLLDLGAAPLDPPTLLADPVGVALGVVTTPPDPAPAGAAPPTATAAVPLASIRVDAVDPAADAVFWAALTGWTPSTATDLRHPSGRGPVLSFRPEPGPKRVKSAVHLDLRLDPGDDLEQVLAGIGSGGGRRLEPGWGELPWTVLTDPSGNEFCLLPARAGGDGA